MATCGGAMPARPTLAAFARTRCGRFGPRHARPDRGSERGIQVLDECLEDLLPFADSNRIKGWYVAEQRVGVHGCEVASGDQMPAVAELTDPCGEGGELSRAVGKYHR